MDHGGPITQGPISEMAEYIKKLIPVNIPGTYTLKPMFEAVAGEENIRSGVIAFRDFIYILCDRLISDGHLYAKPQKNPRSLTHYPFLNDLTILLIEIGYYGKLDERSKSLLISELPSCTVGSDGKGGHKPPKLSASRQMECYRFLALCGFAFTGIDLDARKADISRVQLTEVSYPDNPILLTGLKAMSIADTELRVERSRNDDIFLRCDYRVMKAEDTDPFDMLRDILNPLPEAVQTFALELHRHYIDMGMTCVTIVSSFEVHFAYSYIKNSRRTLSARDIYSMRVWDFALSVKYGYCLFVRSKNTEKYEDVISTFPPFLREKIAKGYGCDRKLYHERCQNGCQGYRIPLDETILELGQDIEIWLDKEVSYAIKR